MRTVKQILEERDKVVADSRKFHEEITAAKREMTKDEETRWAAMNADIDCLKGEADRAARFEKLDGERGAPPPGREDERPEPRAGEVTDETRSLALAGWFAEQNGIGASDEEVEAARSCRLNLRARTLTIPLLGTRGFRAAQRTARTVFGRERDAALAAVECRDMVSNSGPAGGYLTPPEEMIRKLELAMLQYGGIQEHAEVIRTATAHEITWPSGDDTGNVGEWLAEVQSIGTTSVDPTLGKTKWGAHKVSSKPIKVSYELLRDSVFDLPGILAAMLGERIGRAKASAFATGSGAGKPLGLTLSTTQGVEAASASVVTPDELMDLEHSVDLAYRAQGCGYLMKDSTVLHFRKKKNADGSYVWQPGMQAGQPDNINGYPVITCQEMPAIAASAKVIAFGLLSAYKVREVGAIRLRRFVELYGETDQEGFVAFHEVDGGLLDAGTHPVKHLVMHA